MDHSPAFLKIVEDAKSRIQELSGDELDARLKNGEDLNLLDVREHHEFASARLPGAVWLGKGIIERDIESKFPNLDTELILYCGGGYRSALAADNIQKMGYKNVWSLAGGVRYWRADGKSMDEEPI